MSDIDARLEKCFTALFEDLSPAEARAASAHSLAQWDSMATVTLMALVNDEFGVDLDLDEMEPLASFAALRERLEQSRATHG